MTFFINPEKSKYCVSGMDFSFYAEKIIHAHGGFWDCDHLISLSVDKNPQGKAEWDEGERSGSSPDNIRT